MKMAEKFYRIRKGRAFSAPVQTKHVLGEGFGSKLGSEITAVVGTMACALVFAILALVSLPAALATGNTVVIVGWVAQTFLQLVLLPIIIVGQNVQAKAADKRSEQTYYDAENILHEAAELQRHLEHQDEILAKQDEAMAALMAKLSAVKLNPQQIIETLRALPHEAPKKTGK